MSRFSTHLCAMSFASAIATFARAAATINVPADQPTIQAAIDIANAGDVVLVAPGTYAEAISFNGKAITVQGSGGAVATILNGAALNTSIVKFAAAEGPGSVLQGFTLTGGAGTPDAGVRRGGGIYASGSSPTILDCQFINNIITGTPPAAFPTSYGGGVFLQNGSMTLRNCVFMGNDSRGCGGNGGGMYAAIATPLLIECTFIDNGAYDSVGCTGLGYGNGGGIVANSGILINCSFRQNFASGATLMGGQANGGGAMGGSLYVNCEFIGNSTSAFMPRGGGLYTGGTLINCTIANNAASNGPPSSIGGVYSAGSPTLKNCIVFGNSGPDVISTAIVTNSCVEAGFPGAGNISGNPMFINPAGGDFRLAAGSPCIDTGANASLPADTYDFDQDGNITESLSRDLDLLRRKVNGIVDMGAYERQHACLADISPSSPGVAGNGIVNIDDLLAVINAWGTCDACFADVNDDGSVDIDDLLAVIGAWGPCI